MENISMSNSERNHKSWFPLESNPELMTTYARKLGMSANFAFHELLSIEPWAFEMLPSPVLAVLLLYPISASNERLGQEKIQNNGRPVDGVYFMKQKIENACGTIAILHAIGNSVDHEECLLESKPDNWLKTFFQKTKSLSPDLIANELENDDAIEAAHVAAVDAGSTEIDANTNNHFICFVQKSSMLIELDGRKPAAINLGPTSSGSFFADVAKAVQTYMDQDPEEVRFSLIALASSESAS
jgi:ubiquitin carboxyl-terminal hydrolase L3